MKQKSRDIKVGETVILSCGCYSDYQIQGTFKCMKDFNPDDVAQEFISEPNKYGKRDFEDAKFILHLISSQILMEVPVVEIHTRDYGEYSPHIIEHPENSVLRYLPNPDQTASTP